MRARSIVSASFLASVLCAQGCAGDFDPGSRVTSLRVLAVSADLPYAQPGEKVNLTAEWYTPPSDKRQRFWYWLRCVDPDDTSVVGCIKAVGEEVKQTGDVTKAFLNVPDGTDQDTASLTIPDDALSRLPADSRKNATVGIVLLVCPGNLNLTSQTDLTSISTGQVPLECDDVTTKQPLPLDQWVAGIKRIFVRDKDRNANPQFGTVTWDGAAWDASTDPTTYKTIKPCDDDGNRYDRCTTDQHQIDVALAPGSVESGTDEFGSAFTEQVVIEFYSTEGTFEHEVRIAASGTTGFAARKQSKDDGYTPIKIWIVVHDDRGGVSWIERTVQPVP
jgi:hypothetical protein